MATQPAWPGTADSARRVDTESADVKDARTEAERMMQFGHPVAYATVRTLLKDLRDADAEIAWLQTDRNRWQEAYCEARLEARRRDA